MYDINRDVTTLESTFGVSQLEVLIRRSVAPVQVYTRKTKAAHDYVNLDVIKQFI